jgi:hypothetical protein
MSVDATKWAWSLTIAPSRKIVLLSMADRAGETHLCWPSIARLEADTCLDRKTILAAISDLESMGLIAVNRVLGRGNCYQLLGVDGRETSPKNGTGVDAGFSDVTSPKNGTSHKNGTSPKNGTPTSTKNGTPTSTKNGTPTSTKNGTLNLPLNLSMNHTQRETDETPPKTATMAGAVCVALKSIGMGKVAPGNLMLKSLIDAGTDIGVFVEAGKIAVDRQKGFEYMLAIVKKQVQDASQFAEAATANPNAASCGGILPGAI